MQSTLDLSPAERTRRLIAEAKRRAERDAWLVYEQENRAQLEHLRGRSRKPITHGVSGYRRGCKCEECRTAIREKQREYRARKPKEPRESQAKGRGREVKEWMHGSQTGYSYGCRCDDCKKAHAEQRPKSGLKHGTEYGYRKGCRCRRCQKADREARARRAGKTLENRSYKPTPRHGTRARYDRGCGCDKCKAANAQAAREWRERKRAEVSQQGTTVS